MQVELSLWSRRWVALFVALAFVGDAIDADAAIGSFTGLGVMPGDSSSYAYGVSADGSTVVGASYENSSITTAPIHGFRWTATDGKVSIGDLPGGNVSSVAYGVSSNGSVIVGSSSSTLSFSGNPFYHEPFRWTAANGIQGLGYLSNYPSSYGGAADVSADGSVVVGMSVDANGNERPFRWTQSGGMVNLGTLMNFNSNQNQATGVSGDGSVVVGMSRIATGRTAFRWTSGGGMQSLGTLPGAGNGGRELYSFATAVSGDGSTIVGSGYSANGIEAFRWTSAGGLVGLGDLPGGPFSSSANDVSGNGSIIVGEGMAGNDTLAVRWDPVHGIQRIQDLLIANGLASSLVGWQLTGATSISDDGQTIAGWGNGPGGIQGWVATIPIPEPSSFLLSGISLAGWILIARRRRHRSGKPGPPSALRDRV